MKFALTKDHYRYFRENQCLHLEDFLLDEQRKTLRDQIHAVLAQRLGPQWKQEDPGELFTEGYNLHTESEAIRRIISQRRLALVIADLFDCKPLRLGFDLYIPVNYRKIGKAEDPYGEFLRKAKSLKEFSSIHGTKAGLLICLEKPQIEDTSIPFPQEPGQALLFRAHKELPWDFFDDQSQGAYFLTTYTDEIALYFSNKTDPHQHALKRWGYVFGDKLREPHHPIICR